MQQLPSSTPITVTSHNDTDGITAAAIMTRALSRENKSFSLNIVKSLTKEYVESLPENHVLIFTDLASNSLAYLAQKKNEVVIIDHHEITQDIPENVRMINPVQFNEENMCSAGLCYRVAKKLSEQNTDLATLAVIGMVGDMHETHAHKEYQKILSDAEVHIKKGLLLYPATRPLDRVLESSHSLFIPGVTGSIKGTLELLRETGIEKTPRGYKSLAELTPEEMERLTTSIMLKQIGNEVDPNRMVGNMYLIKFFNHMEDAREMSALINACSRMDQPEISLGFCLGNKTLRKEATRVYTKYRKTISSALGDIESMEKIAGNKYTIINAKDTIKDTIVGTVTSIMSFSPVYEEGTILVTMAYTPEDTIKVSARIAGRNGRNVREILEKAVSDLDNVQIGGHPQAAGCLLEKPHEEAFITSLKRALDIELIKV